MRLFEVDLGSARDVLAVLQGQANRAGQSSTLPFAVVIKLIQPFGLGISSPDGLIALKNKVDPAGDVIQDIDDQGNVKYKPNSWEVIGKKYKQSSLEICVVDIDCIGSIKKDDQLKEKSIQQMSKEPKYSTGEFSTNKLIKKPT